MNTEGAVFDLSNAVASAPAGNSSAGQGPAASIDSESTTEWLDYEVTPLLISLPQPIQPAFYKLTTDSAVTARDAVRFELHGSSDNLVWRILHAQSTDLNYTDQGNGSAETANLPVDLCMGPQVKTAYVQYLRFFPITLRVMDTGEWERLWRHGVIC